MATDIETQTTDLSRHETYEEKVHVADSEWASLRRVPDKLPKIALLILAVEVSVHIPYNDASLTQNVAGRTLYILWSQRTHPELHQVSSDYIHKSLCLHH
jgi:hypothetical protein